MSAAPRVSVVLAVHDQARWLPETIASVRAQSFTDWELLVVDDGSTDDTPAIVARATADPRIRHLRGPHRERCVARNRGIAAATADLIAFLDGDDLWLPEKLARQVAALDAAPDVGLCYTIARYVDAEGRPLPICRPAAALTGDLFPALVRANPMVLASVVVRRSVLEQVGGFDEGMPTIGCEDWDLWLRISRDHPVVGVPEELTRYRVHGTNTGWAQVLAGGTYVIDKTYADPGTERRARCSRRTAQARLLWYHVALAAAEDRRAALGLAARAVRSAPASVASRPALGALAALVLPVPVLRAFGRLPA
jgi:glycosyltransferase involved in cell wall biosynthesis